MKLLMNTLLVCFLCTGIAFACPPDGAKASNIEKSENAAKVDVKFASLDLSVKGMTCAGCENKVKAALGGIDGVVETKRVDAVTDEASLTYDPSVVSEDDLIATLSEKTGYSISVIKSAGMTEKDAKKCSADCKKECCAGKAKASCTKAQKASCTKAQKASCAKSKASGDKKLEKAE